MLLWDMYGDDGEKLLELIIPMEVDYNAQKYRVTSIGNGAFMSSTQNPVETILLPESVLSIGDRAFHGLASLTFVNIPSNVIYIGADAFYGCSSSVGK